MEDVWETSANLDFFQTFQTIPNKEFATLEEYYTSDASDMGIYKATTPIPELSGYLAVTQIFYSPSTDENGRFFLKMDHVDVIVNDAEYNFSTDPADTANYYYGTLLLHELGHSIGIGHIKDGIMTNTGMTTEENRVSLNDSEIATIISKYSGVVPGNALMAERTVLEYEVDTSKRRILLYMKRQ